jgi:Fic family protein
VKPLVADLTAYINGAAHAPLIQAALVHAQFETVHPFTDGNGRVGRALVHTVLARRGLTRVAVLPISVVLLTRSRAYVDGLTAYRYTGAPDGAAAAAGIRVWLDTFLDAVSISVDQASAFAADVCALHAEWEERLATHRGESGRRTRPRANSATARLLETLTEAPMLTARTVQRLLGVSFPSARAALEELADARVLTRKSVDKKTTGYLAREVFDLITFAERRLVSTRWDTRQAPTSRPAPSLPRPGSNAP